MQDSANEMCAFAYTQCEAFSPQGFFFTTFFKNLKIFIFYLHSWLSTKALKERIKEILKILADA